MSADVLLSTYVTITPISCMGQKMPLHPSTAFGGQPLNMLEKEGKTPNDYLVGVAGFEPATRASLSIVKCQRNQ
jgi:hypothetical protein